MPLLWPHSRILLNSVVKLAVGEWPSLFMLPWRCTSHLNACLLWQCKSSPSRWHCQLKKLQLRALLRFKCLMKNPMLKSEQVFLLKRSKRTCSCSFPLHSPPSSLSHQQRCVYWTSCDSSLLHCISLFIFAVPLGIRCEVLKPDYVVTSHACCCEDQKNNYKNYDLVILRSLYFRESKRRKKYMQEWGTLQSNRSPCQVRKSWTMRTSASWWKSFISVFQSLLSDSSLERKTQVFYRVTVFQMWILPWLSPSWCPICICLW